MRSVREAEREIPGSAADATGITTTRNMVATTPAIEKRFHPLMLARRYPSREPSGRMQRTFIVPFVPTNEEELQVWREPVRGSYGDIRAVAYDGLERMELSVRGAFAPPPIHHLTGLT